ncbi:hypothetical protein [Streptomyces sp. NPDC059916]
MRWSARSLSLTPPPRHPVSVPDTGSLRGDVLALLRDINATRAHWLPA